MHFFHCTDSGQLRPCCDAVGIQKCSLELASSLLTTLIVHYLSHSVAVPLYRIHNSTDHTRGSMVQAERSLHEKVG